MKRRSISEMNEETLRKLIMLQENKLAEIESLRNLLFDYTDLQIDLLLWLKQYCEAKNIPLWKEKRFHYLIETLQKIFKQMDDPLNNIEQLFGALSDESLQHKKSDKDLTEPHFFINRFSTTKEIA